MGPFPEISKLGFDLEFTYHADAILGVHFPDAMQELDEIFSRIRIPITELVGGGGGETRATQRLRQELNAQGWKKRNFAVEKKIGGIVTYASSHEVDHVKDFREKSIAAEIEWNNKDPFFDRDLENFYRLHQDGAISCGLVITRGKSFQDEIEERLRTFAYTKEVRDFTDLEAFGIKPTDRQNRAIAQRSQREGTDFPTAWARHFKSDKFGAATTHWDKLSDRLARGVGSPCPLIAIGIPIDCVVDK
jgi:hypothetical protein